MATDSNSLERLIFLATLDTTATHDWTEVAERMGGSYSVNTIRQKFYKLKREAEAMVAGSGDGSAPSTPTGKTTTGGSNKSGGKRKKAASGENGDTGDKSEASPSKARKTKKDSTQAAAKTVEKKEQVEDDKTDTVEVTEDPPANDVAQD